MKIEIRASTESQQILHEIEQWADRRVHGFQKFEKYGLYLEHHSVEHLIKDYIVYFNRNVRELGNGFDADWDFDDKMIILYKNGRIREVNPEFDYDDGTKFISRDYIDSIIVDGGWGTAFAGPSIIFRDETFYDDNIDIRVDFK